MINVTGTLVGSYASVPEKKIENYAITKMALPRSVLEPQVA